MQNAPTVATVATERPPQSNLARKPNQENQESERERGRGGGEAGRPQVENSLVIVLFYGNWHLAGICLSNGSCGRDCTGNCKLVLTLQLGLVLAFH